MAQNYSPKIVQDGLILCLDSSQNKSYPTTDLPVKDGLLVWLDAADDSTFSYSSGTKVSQWRDKSGNNFHANQATVANQPSRNTTVNSRKSVNFSSANGDRLRVNSGMVFTNSVTAIVFIKPGSQSFAYADILDQDHAMDGYNGWVIQRNNTASQWLVWLANASNTTWLNTNAISYADNTPQIVTLIKGSSTLTLYSNGTTSGDVAVADQQIRQANYFGLNIGSWRAGNELFASTRHYNGEICEIVVYNKALSLTELKQVHTYLGQKWGVGNTDRSIIDLSGNNNHGLLGNGTVANMPVADYYNKFSLRFDGVNDSINCGQGSSMQLTTDITVEAWIYITSSPNDWVRIIGTGTSSGSPTNRTFGLWYYGPTRYLLWQRLGGSDPAIYVTSTQLNLNTWYHVTATTSGTAHVLYLNGVSIGTATAGGPWAWSNENVTIGYAGYHTYHNGFISNAKLYNRGLSATEVFQNYQTQKSKFDNTIVQQGLVLNLDAGNPYSYAGSGTTWFDVSGNNYSGSLISGSSFNSDGGGCIVFDGVDDYVQTNLNQNTDNASITWEAWFWDNSAGGFIGNTAIISNYGPNATTPFTLVHIDVNGYPFFGQRNSSGTEESIYYSTNICNSVWHQIVGVVDGSNMHLYIDGVLRGSKTKITGTTTSGQNIVIGSNHLGRYQSCRIASARLYNIALSATQVSQNYNAVKDRYGL